MDPGLVLLTTLILNIGDPALDPFLSSQEAKDPLIAPTESNVVLDPEEISGPLGYGTVSTAFAISTYCSRAAVNIEKVTELIKIGATIDNLKAATDKLPKFLGFDGSELLQTLKLDQAKVLAKLKFARTAYANVPAAINIWMTVQTVRQEFTQLNLAYEILADGQSVADKCKVTLPLIKKSIEDLKGLNDELETLLTDHLNAPDDDGLKYKIEDKVFTFREKIKLEKKRIENLKIRVENSETTVGRMVEQRWNAIHANAPFIIFGGLQLSQFLSSGNPVLLGVGAAGLGYLALQTYWGYGVAKSGKALLEELANHLRVIDELEHMLGQMDITGKRAERIKKIKDEM